MNLIIIISFHTLGLQIHTNNRYKHKQIQQVNTPTNKVDHTNQKHFIIIIEQHNQLTIYPSFPNL